MVLASLPKHARIVCFSTLQVIMLTSLDAPEILNREFLEVRAKLLQVAATLDRLERAPGSTDDDPRRQKIARALAILSADCDDRAEQLQMLFSLPYDASWKNGLAIPKRPK